MNTSNKAILIGVISFFGFLIGNIILGNIVGLLIPGGDDFLNSYFLTLLVKPWYIKNTTNIGNIDTITSLKQVNNWVI